MGLLFLIGEIFLVVSAGSYIKIMMSYNFIYIAVECPAGMVYQQCGPVCPKTCDTDEDEDCNNGCIEGCFCPSGQVIFNENCINYTECAGNHF